MKYDQHLLESAYKKIYVKEDIANFDNLPDDPSIKNRFTPDKDNVENSEIEQEDEREETNDSMQEIINELGNRIASENLLKNLNALTSNGIDDLILILNEKEEWALKDNLIRFLFVLKDYEFSTNSLG
jgi:restriction endonuclease Mrr